MAGKEEHSGSKPIRADFDAVNENSSGDILTQWNQNWEGLTGTIELTDDFAFLQEYGGLR